ncbi:alkaline phosphatase family protein [Planctomicrobium piriforme]|uniref:Predicted pyrophosphatase or phosphodiesterase, AlkP superfamily n=1 Tax=Planctomicrobium piriforme TaxID=1576369 RepID=A0A1I3EM79_9PLAN|nr:nucleotide pyrophosphatase/phosphodiesterase family protein [Planctomicrobium piriforme]SFH99988.1 Predicted pyrophosphatase or phosphodiesterase, AlkP superfamily [Planctomicrobium piriforme]
MAKHVVLISVPGLRRQDLASMPNLSGLAAQGSVATLSPTFPAVTCPVQANMTTGVGPEKHGIIANGFFYRDRGEVEMWTAWNSCFQAPQIWDILHQKDPSLTSAVWFPLHSKGAGSDYICTPAPIHNPDGSESLWCYTKPTELYGELRDQLGHFPLMHFWGPLANIKSSDWIIDSAVIAAKKFAPRFSYIYIPHLDYAAQKNGPNSPQAAQAVVDIDRSLGRLLEGYKAAGLTDVHWLVASEYVIEEVDSVVYPNRMLREAGLLALKEENGREYLLPGQSPAWALVDHQLAHIFVHDADDIDWVADMFREHPQIAHVLVGEERRAFSVDHPRSGDIVLIAQPNAWFAYYWWEQDDRAPEFARTVDIHKKPGYDPVEMFIEMPARAIPLDATLVRGSHGYPADSPARKGVLLSSSVLSKTEYQDTDVAGLVLSDFGVTR